ncbi:MAG: type IV pilin [Halobacteriales archaeon]
MPDRGLSPVVGAVCLVVVVVGLVGATVAILPGTPDGASDPTRARLSLTANASDAGGGLELRHEGGTPIDLREVDVEIDVDGVPLAHQPAVPFNGHRGFNGAASGAFHPETDDVWRAGETAGLTIAATSNHPTVEPGSQVTVRIRRDDRVVAEVSAAASA